MEGQGRGSAESEEEEDGSKQSDRESQEEPYVKDVHRHLWHNWQYEQSTF